MPGAVVCAYDVDAWWWWWSTQQVGCATTDATGSFTLSFRWCCGWLPWWWWRLRRWTVEPWLARNILGALQRQPRIPRLPIPEPDPAPGFFERLLGAAAAGPRAAPALQPGWATHASHPAAAAPVVARAARAMFDPARLEAVRERLAELVPEVPALAGLRLWPWWPWQPWWDCTPDIVFRATQQCHGAERVIVSEGLQSVRRDIPTTLDVTLTASEEACCIPTGDCAEGDCLALAKVCGFDADEVGGNPGAAPAPAGYARPNLIASNGDAPFAEVVEIRGTAQCLTGIRLLQILFSPDGLTWLPVPPAALGTFAREYWDFGLGTDVDVPFSAQVPIDGHHVYETVEHYEATHSPADWGGAKVWLGTNLDMIVPWVTNPTFADGTYRLKVVGYTAAGGVLTSQGVLKVCGSDADAQLTVTLDNQSTFPPPGPLDNPCGPGTSHACTREPDTDIVDVRIVRAGGDTVPVGACGNVKLAAGDQLEVDLVAHDAQGHLASYSLVATYGENLSRDLLALGGVLSPLGGVPGVPAASQVGPDYAAARTAPQTAVAPTWTGGAIRLSIPAALAFPETCCYQLELRAYKRTIVSCQDNNAHQNLSERSFQITV
ncbi:MAG: hypothetical protein QM767_18735 [Anaeromyxobacter sp.]